MVPPAPLRRAQVEALFCQGQDGFGAATAYLATLARGGPIRRVRLAWFIWRNRGYLRRAPATWVAVGKALAESGAHAAAVRWLEDWPSRRGVQPAMLLVLADALRRQRREVEAAGVSQRALALTPDRTTPLHRRWLAVEEATAGDPARVPALLAEAGPASDDRDRYLGTLATAVAAFRLAPGGGRGADLAAARPALEQARRTLARCAGERELRFAHIRAAAVAARQAGGIAAQLWFRSVQLRTRPLL